MYVLNSYTHDGLIALNELKRNACRTKSSAIPFSSAGGQIVSLYRKSRGVEPSINPLTLSQAPPGAFRPWNLNLELWT